MCDPQATITMTHGQLRDRLAAAREEGRAEERRLQCEGYKSPEQKLADLIRREWSFVVDAPDVARLIRAHWDTIAPLAHLIHEGRS